MVAQPFDRGAVLKAPGELDPELGEFWTESSWTIGLDHNLSYYERNRTFLNAEGRGFLDISHVTGTDSNGDGRSVVPADFNNDGRIDLLVRQVGGGALLLFENDFPQRRFLTVSLRGEGANRLGIGARLVAEFDGRTIVRELYPANTSGRSQKPALVHFGLGESKKVDTLSVRWPSGKEQLLKDLAADRHVLLDETSGQVEEITPGKRFDH